jgi:hypothetical protein
MLQYQRLITQVADREAIEMKQVVRVEPFMLSLASL